MRTSQERYVLTLGNVVVPGRRLFLSLLWLLSLLLLSQRGGLPAAEAHSTSGGHLINVRSTKCLDVRGGFYDNEIPIQQFTCNGTGAQTFDMTDLGNGYHQIRFRHSGKCLDVKGGSTQSGAQLQQYECNGTEAQQFKVPTSTGYVQNRRSGLCLTVDPGNYDDWALVKQYPCSFDTWRLTTAYPYYYDHTSPTYGSANPMISGRTQPDLTTYLWKVNWWAYSWIRYTELTPTSITVAAVNLSFHVDQSSPAGTALNCNPQYTSPLPADGKPNYRVNSGSPFPKGPGSSYWYLSTVNWNSKYDKSQYRFSLLNTAGPWMPFSTAYYEVGNTCAPNTARNADIDSINRAVVCWFGKIGTQNLTYSTQWTDTKMNTSGYCWDVW